MPDGAKQHYTAAGQHYMVPRRYQRVLEGITRHQMALDGAWTALHGAKTALDGAWYHCLGAVAGALVRRQSGKRLRCYGFQSHFPLHLSTKTPILCSKCPKTRVPKGKSAQKCRFCARENGDWHLEDRKLASGSATVPFLQITARAPKI